MINQHTSLFNMNGYITTYSGIEVNLNAPTVEMINITDIAKALSNSSHWNGQTRIPFTVAQHSVMVSWAAPDHLKKLGLLHDAAEAYLGDMVKPVKVLLEPHYDLIEARMRVPINEKYGLNECNYEDIKTADRFIIRLEWEYFFENNPQGLINFTREKTGKNDFPDVWPHTVAEWMFHYEFNKLFKL